MNKFPILQKRYLIEEFVLFLLLVSSLIGMGITDFSPDEGHRYWTGLIIFYALACIGLGWSRIDKSKQSLKELIIQQLFHWGGNHADRFRGLFNTPYRAYEL